MRLLPLILLACACVKNAPQSSLDPELRVSGGTVVGSPAGISSVTGTPVAVQVMFKDETPPCLMKGGVTFTRDAEHRWVYLQPQEGCPEWLAGSWWAELTSGATGWYMSEFARQPHESQR